MTTPTNEQISDFDPQIRSEHRHLDANEQVALSESLRRSVRKSDIVTIPRSQHDALMAAAKAWMDDNWDIVRSVGASEIQCQCSVCAPRLTIYTALRAAGIEVEEKP
jgi:hypothetical protein